MRAFVLLGFVALLLSGCCPWCHHDRHPGYHRQGPAYEQGPELGEPQKQP